MLIGEFLQNQTDRMDRLLNGQEQKFNLFTADRKEFASKVENKLASVSSLDSGTWKKEICDVLNSRPPEGFDLAPFINNIKLTESTLKQVSREY